MKAGTQLPQGLSKKACSFAFSLVTVVVFTIVRSFSNHKMP